MNNGNPRTRGRRSNNVAQAGNIVDYMLRTGEKNRYLQSGARNISVVRMVPHALAGGTEAVEDYIGRRWE